MKADANTRYITVYVKHMVDELAELAIRGMRPLKRTFRVGFD
ncbi:MAG: hypothetical protein ACT4O2_06110 [Beijerinckiaceae bacterium]